MAVASACATVGAQAHAQEANTEGASNPLAPAATNTVVVTGIRAALQSTLNLKRNSDGFVDGIAADDIGKFPDTNLAEALQRISGVSIDRNRGEGALVTVRGVGPDLNLVLLNGRQMPTANLGDQSGRAFDFSNLAAEAVSQIQVYKSVRADVTPGGIGATLNVMTGRPLDLGKQSSFGAKVMYDSSNDNLPQQQKASRSYTPELSGLYSTTWNDGMFGLSASASYQERNMGVNTAAVINGWLGPYRIGQTGDGALTQPGHPNFPNIVNPPTGDTLYQLPQNLSYKMNGYQRKRTNGQLTFQFRPTKDLTTTLDYTYAENKIEHRYSELSAWFGHNVDIQGASFTGNGSGIASPLYYEERHNTDQDLSMNGGDSATKSTLNSIGFNTQWRATPDLTLTVDAHHSVAEAKSDSPYGINNDLATASFSRRTTRADFTNEMPVLSVTGIDFNRAPHQVAGSWFQDGRNKMKLDQLQLGGKLKLFERSGLNFGTAFTKNENFSIFQQVQRDTWTGTVPNTSAAYDQSLWHPADLRDYFGKLGGAGNPALFTQINPFDFEAVRNQAIAITGDQAGYTPSLANPAYNRTTIERTRSVYFQFNTDWDTALPMHTGIGFRWEQTRVASTGLTKVPTGIRWISANELPVDFGSQVFETLTGKYNNFLPSLDWDMDLRSDLKLRASYGVSIGRARYDQIAGGSTYGTTATVTGTTVSRGNPALEPVKSKNLDLSAEWYYNKQSMFSLGAFHKKLEDYTGSTVITEGSPTATTPVGGRYWNAALAAGCASSDRTCIRNYILNNFNGQEGVTRTGINSAGNAEGTIRGIAGDPALPYQVSTLVNSQGATLKGAEVNWQHMFANGFGFQANYTYVKSDLTFDNLGVGNQFALVGLSDSANFVGIYENPTWSVRAAYNWRDKFLSSTNNNNRPNPTYVEPYGQLDISIGYNVSKNLSLSLEAINVNDETQRVHGRTEMQVLSISTGGRRYMVGARYKF
ncbi:TonB-dependent receptor [Massilia sp. KIM]|nr:TonB-dependent receptor [Massilia sp. KIM]